MAGLSGCSDDPAPEAKDTSVADTAADTTHTDTATAQDAATKQDIDGPKDTGAKSGCTTAKDCPVPTKLCFAAACDPDTGCYEKLSPDGAVCDDGDSCTAPDTCDKGNCKAGADKTCDDKNPCTKDTCDSKTGQCANLPDDGASCDDGDPGTANDTCKAGDCKGEQLGCAADSDCKDAGSGNLCEGTYYCDKAAKPAKCTLNPTTKVNCKTVDDTICSKNQCDPKTGTCAMTPSKDGTACDDGDKCTAGDVCAAGKCSKGATNICCATDKECESKDDGNKCNGVMFCNQATGACQFNPASVVKCKTVDDTDCLATECVPTTGKCETGPVNQGKSCEADGTACTPADKCNKGKCEAANNVCQCKSDKDCADKDDGDLCNGTLYCDKSVAKPVCRVNEASIIHCKSVDDTECAHNRCDKKTGDCGWVALPDATTCDYDGNPCTAKDQCKDGTCQGNPVLTCECAVDADCGKFEDGDLCNGTLFCHVGTKKCRLNPATVVRCETGLDTGCEVNRCSKKTGKCAVSALTDGTSCNADSSKCTANDTCKTGKCQAGANICDCQTDKDCAALDDSDPCTPAHVCDGKLNKCVVNKASIVKCSPWQDSDCLANRCDSKTGKCALQPTNELGNCNADDNPCSVYDTCSKGKCIAGANVCECALDGECDPYQDNDKCTAELYCHKPGQPPWFCEPNPAKVVSCPAGVGCATQKCDPLTGSCKPTNAIDGKPCDDGSACTSSDACVLGKCVGAAKECPAGDVCTTLLCDDKTGICAKTSKVCNDNNPCTDDSCDAKKGGCVATPNTSKCDDQQACTLADACTVSDGKAVCAGQPNGCDDNNPCTTDQCDKATGKCLHAANTGACDDGDGCTVKDACKDNKCSGQARNCDDGNGCTDDSCGQGGKCQNSPKNAVSCDDGDACTTGDVCAQSACGGVKKDCDDGKLCTVDSCDAKTGCKHSPVGDGGVCGDSKSCMGTGVCKSGACTGQKAQLWSKQLARTELWQELHDVAVTPNGRIVGVGYVGGTNGKSAQKAWQVSFDLYGTPKVEVVGTVTEELYRVLPVTGDDVVALGTRWISNSFFGVVRHMGPTLTAKWERLEPESRRVWAGITPVQGGYVVVGHQQSGSKVYFRAAKLSSVDGKPVWEHGTSDVNGLRLQHVAALADGSTWAIGDDGSANTLLMRLSKDGKVTASRSLRTVYGDSLLRARVLKGDRLGVAVQLQNDSNGMMVFKPDLELLRYTVMVSGTHARSNDLSPLPDGGALWVGRGLIDKKYQVVFAALDKDGEVVSRTTTPVALSHVGHRVAPIPSGGYAMIYSLSSTPATKQRRAVVARLDSFGRSTCPDSGVCFSKSQADCSDKKPCTPDTCDPSKGCQHPVGTGEACTNGAPCFKAGECDAGACKSDPRLGNFEVTGSKETIEGVTGYYDYETVTVGTLAEAGKPLQGVFRRYDRHGKSLSKAFALDAGGKDTTLHGVALHHNRRFLAVGSRDGKAYLTERYDKLGAYSELVVTTTNVQQLNAATYVPSDGGFVAVGWEEQADKSMKGLVVRRGPNKKIIEWVKTFGTAGDVSLLQDVTGTKEGTFISVGTARSANQTPKLWLLAMDEAGTQKWSKAHFTPQVSLTVGSVALAGDDATGAGLLAITAADPTTNVGRLYRAKLDGSLIGDSDLPVGGAAKPEFRAIRAVAGGFVVLGDVGDTDRARVLAKVADTGQVIWTKTLLRKGQPNTGTALWERPDGDLVVAGFDGDPDKGQLAPYLARVTPWGDIECKAAGGCGGKLAADCDDGKACTADFCDPAKGCQHAAITGCK